jgi:hypothetical protein
MIRTHPVEMIFNRGLQGSKLASDGFRDGRRSIFGRNHYLFVDAVVQLQVGVSQPIELG